MTFLAANVIVDARATLIFLGFLDGQLHGPLHTYLGTLVLAVILTSGVLLVVSQFPETARFSSRPESVSAVALASISGTWLAVTLDAFLYGEMQPFYPLGGNPLHGLVGPLSIYGFCAIAFIIGAGRAGVVLVNRWSVSG